MPLLHVSFLPLNRAADQSNTVCLNSMAQTMLFFFVICVLQMIMVLPFSGAVIAEDTNNSLQVANDSLLTTECDHYNRTTCLADGTSCSGTEQCSLRNTSRQNAHCYVTWRNSSDGKVEVEQKGCFFGDESCRGETECIAKSDLNILTKNRPHYYCCCFSNNCNRNFSREAAPRTIHVPPSNTNVGVLLMVLCVVGSLIVMGIAVCIVFYCYRKSKMPPYFHQLNGSASVACSGGVSSSEFTSSMNASLLPNTASPSELSQHTVKSSSALCLSTALNRPVQLIQIKAKGRFGALWMASHNEELVAVKIFPLSDHESWQMEKEVYGLPQMKHPNILEFIGVEKHGDGLRAEFWLITAYHYRGSLSDYLKANTVTWPELLRISHSMAQGLCYLHEEQPATAREDAKPIIAHRDFKSKNVLLKADLSACIADFGLAIIFYQGQLPGDTHGQVGTRRYMAPEVLEGAISFQAEAFLRIDMYAVGLVLWELLSRCSAQSGSATNYKLPFEREVGYQPTLDDMQECVVVRKCRPEIKEEWLANQGMSVVVSTMEECWDHDSEARLTAACVVERFSGLTSLSADAVDDAAPSQPSNELKNGISSARANNSAIRLDSDMNPPSLCVQSDCLRQSSVPVISNVSNASKAVQSSAIIASLPNSIGSSLPAAGSDTFLSKDIIENKHVSLSQNVPFSANTVPYPVHLDYTVSNCYKNFSDASKAAPYTKHCKSAADSGVGSDTNSQISCCNNSQAHVPFISASPVISNLSPPIPGRLPPPLPLSNQCVEVGRIRSTPSQPHVSLKASLIVHKPHQNHAPV